MRSREEIEELARLSVEQPQLRAAQRALADDVTALVHSEAERDAAAAAGAALFGRSELRDLPEHTLAAAAAELGATSLELPLGADLPSVVDALELGGVVSSKSAARRSITDGGAYLNNAKVSDPQARLTPADLLHGRYVIVRRGKRTVGALIIERP
jgi:tyrosyl-tRNA synthetase